MERLAGLRQIDELCANLLLNWLRGSRLSEPYARTSAVLGYEFHTRSFHCGAHLTDAAKARILPQLKTIYCVDAHFRCPRQIGGAPPKRRARHPAL